jgi:hypothetical protein
VRTSPQALALALLASSTALSQEAGARAMFFGGFEKKSSPAKPPVAAAKTAKKEAPTRPTETATRNNPGPRVPAINAAVGGALGLRYSILKVEGANSFEVPANTRFKSGDRIQLQVESNSDGYLYIVTQGSSGAWQVMFPKATAANGSNRVQAGDVKSLLFRFDAKPGTEKLFVMLSRVPETDLDQAIYKLATGADEPIKTNEKPKRAPADAGQMLMASNAAVPDPLVSRLRTSYTRDLVLEEVSATDTQERAVYVATKAKSNAARVVADIKLVHE